MTAHSLQLSDLVNTIGKMQKNTSHLINQIKEFRFLRMRRLSLILGCWWSRCLKVPSIKRRHNCQSLNWSHRRSLNYCNGRTSILISQWRSFHHGKTMCLLINWKVFQKSQIMKHVLLLWMMTIRTKIKKIWIRSLQGLNFQTHTKQSISKMVWVGTKYHLFLSFANSKLRMKSRNKYDKSKEGGHTWTLLQKKEWPWIPIKDKNLWKKIKSSFQKLQLKTFQ